eukprot:5379247-Prorocentrum_lima.AAC.1
MGMPRERAREASTREWTSDVLKLTQKVPSTFIRDEMGTPLAHFQPWTSEGARFAEPPRKLA